MTELSEEKMAKALRRLELQRCLTVDRNCDTQSLMCNGKRGSNLPREVIKSILGRMDLEFVKLDTPCARGVIS